MLRAAKKCGVRVTRDLLRVIVLEAGTRNWKRRIQLGILRSFQESFREALGSRPDDSERLRRNRRRLYGLTLQTFRQLEIEDLPEGTWEFVTHPGYNDAELNNVKTRLRQSRENELEILTSYRGERTAKT